MGEFDGEVAVVSGGTRGIGRAIVESFLEEGAKVAALYTKSIAEADKIRLIGALPIRCDVAKRVEVRRAAEIVRTELGNASILVNNAGIMYPMSLEEYDEKLFNDMLSVNVKGVINTTLEFLPQLKSTEGAVINIASNAGIGTALGGTTYYAVTKAGVIILTKRMAFELGKYGIRVNAVAPGWVETDLTTANRSPSEVESIKESIRAKTMLGMAGLPDHIAPAVLFLASRKAKYITGQVVVADGGRIDYLSHSI